jgi:hypothetical protein
VRVPGVKELLEPAQRLLENEFFWRHQDDGLALFLSGSLFKYYRLPFQFQELVVVADRFHIKPLLPLFTGDGRFFLLALSQKRLKLFEGTRYTLSELELEGVPRSISEALGRENTERQLQARSMAAGGSRTTLFHGHGAGVEDTKQDLFRFFREIDKGLKDLLKDQRAPMVLAGVDYLLPIYQEANSYPMLLPDGVTGNPDGLSAQDLHAAALRLVRPHFEKAQRDASAKYRELYPTGRCSTQIKEIVPAAASGRVEFVFVPVGVQRWGTFDPDRASVEVHEERQPGDQELLNLVAVHAILNRGSVFAVQPSEIPDRAPAAALFRY